MCQNPGIPLLTSLSSIYPGIQGELENRHTNHYSLVHESFKKTYQTPPELYICVNRTIDLIRPHDMGVRVSMGCENGLIIALSRTEKGSSIFVNGKGLEEEIELSCKGNIIKNQAAEFSTIIQNAIDTGIEDCSLNALHGGIMYYHSQLPKDDKTGWLFGFTLASIVLNKMEGEYTLREIEMKIESLLQREIFKEKCLVNKLLIRGWDERQPSHLGFHLENTKLVIGDLLMTQEEQLKIKLKEEQLTLEMEFIEMTVCNALGFKRMGLDKLQAVMEVDSGKFQEVCSSHLREEYTREEVSTLLNKSIESIEEFSPRRRLELYFRQLKTLEEFLESPTEPVLDRTFESILEVQRSLGYLSERIESVIKECLSEYGSSCCLVENRYLAVVTTKQKFIWLFELFKKNVFQDHQGQPIVQGNVQHLLFSTRPATGVALMDLSNEMWY